MNITIKDFTQADFNDYLSYSIDGYAEANIKSGRWTAEEGRAKSQQQFDSLLKDGFKSEGLAFWKIHLDGKKIGDFWFHRKPVTPDTIFVFDTNLKEEYRSQGIGTFTFPIIQERLKALGVRTINLHVFAHNSGAVRLYERLGFEFVSHNMNFTFD